jgi:hypothetical protein
MQAQMLQTMQQSMVNMQQTLANTTELAGTAAAIERQAWRIPKDQAANFLTLCETHGH